MGAYDGGKQITAMNDLIFVGLTTGFFVLAAAYIRFCDKVR